MNINLISTVPNLTIGSLTWTSIGDTRTVDTSTLKAYERANIENAYALGNLISNPVLLNNSISATEDNVSPAALGGDVRASVNNGQVVLSAPGIPSIPTGSGSVTVTSYDASSRVNTYTQNAVTWTVAYNAEGNPATETGSNGKVRTWNYDSNGRFLSVTEA